MEWELIFSCPFLKYLVGTAPDIEDIHDATNMLRQMKTHKAHLEDEGVQPKDDGVQPKDEGVQPTDEGVQPYRQRRPESFEGLRTLCRRSV